MNLTSTTQFGGCGDGWSLDDAASGGTTAKSVADSLLLSRDGRRRGLLSLAPMMDWSHRYWRYMMRMVTTQAMVYTEMVVDSTIEHTDNLAHHLGFSPEEHPIACQLGGSDPERLAHAADVAAGFGYDEINLNCGCPSNRVAQNGCFGARLMMEPEVVRRACAAMIRRCPRTPVTVKCRLGADAHDTYAHAYRFVATVAQSGVRHFIVHARKCHLNGLNPQQNRTIPPLKYDWVLRLARDFPELDISLNGGVQTVEAAEALLRLGTAAGGGDAGSPLWSLMVGRAAWNNPWEWRDVDSRLFGSAGPGLTRRQVAMRFAEHCDALRRQGYICRGADCSSPLVSLFRGERNSGAWRRSLTKLVRSNAGDFAPLVADACATMPDELLDAPPSR